MQQIRQEKSLMQSLTQNQLAELKSKLTDEELAALRYDWSKWARPKQLAPRGDWNGWLILAGRGFGKELDIETPILTSEGWKLFGELRIGDKVFDEQGNFTNVTAIFDTNPNKCYRLYFDDGTWIDAGQDHQWVTWTHSDRKAYLRSQYEDKNIPPEDWISWSPNCIKAHYSTIPSRVRTTQQIIDSFSLGKRNNLNHCIFNTGSLQFDRKELLIDPLILGLWLGDGISTKGEICGATQDLLKIRSFIEQRGHKIKRMYTRTNKNGNQLSYLQIEGLSQKLKQENLLKNKHIPEKYLFGDHNQRLDLLKGLYTTDGTVDEYGTKCEFSNCNEQIAKGALFLIRSLGMKGRICNRIPRCGNVEGARNWRVYALPTMDLFILKRKSERLKLKAQRFKYYHRMITRFEEIPIKPMRCITVDSPNSMYLIGEQLLPTHNTRTACEYARQAVERGECKRIALVAETSKDGRDVIAEGESGLLSVCPPWDKPVYESSKKRLTWSNGAQAFLYDAREPDQLRGPQHDLVIFDELAKYRYAQEVFDQAMFGLRLGANPKWIATTTPRPIPLIKSLIKDSSVHTTTAISDENLDNLAASFRKNVIERYRGTRLGRQELNAEILGDVPGALWRRSNLDEYRVKEAPLLIRIVVAIDPAVTNEENSNETGIIVVGIDKNGQGYVLDDYSMRGRPDEWAQRAIAAYRFYQADCIVAEVNQGGLIVESLMRSVAPYISYKAVHATRGKIIRAEPISALYEQGRIHHVGCLVDLEDQMITFTPDSILNNSNRSMSPDRVDALVWGLTELFPDIIIPRKDEKEEWDEVYEQFNRKTNSTRNNITGY